MTNPPLSDPVLTKLAELSVKASMRAGKYMPILKAPKSNGPMPSQQEVDEALQWFCDFAMPVVEESMRLAKEHNTTVLEIERQLEALRAAEKGNDDE